MAIAAGSAFVNAVTSTTNTVSGVTTSGTDRVGIVGIKETNGATELCTGVTWGGVSMTRINSARIPAERWTSLWYIVAPATASSSVVASYSASTFSRVHAMSYTGVDQTTPIDNSGTNTSSAIATFNTSLTTIADNCWAVMVVANDSGNHAAGTATTLRGAASDSNIMDSNAAKTPAGSVTLQATLSGAKWASVIASLLPAGGGGGPTFTPRAVWFT